MYAANSQAIFCVCVVIVKGHLFNTCN